MANRNFSKVQGLQRELKILECSFMSNNTSQPSQVQGLGIKSVTRTDVGELKVSLQDSYYDIKAIPSNFFMLDSVTPALAGMAHYIKLDAANTKPWRDPADPHFVIQFTDDQHDPADLPANHSMQLLILCKNTAQDEPQS